MASAGSCGEPGSVLTGALTLTQDGSLLGPAAPAQAGRQCHCRELWLQQLGQELPEAQGTISPWVCLCS